MQELQESIANPRMKIKLYLLFLAVSLVADTAFGQGCNFDPEPDAQSITCQLVSEPVCREIDYNTTTFPNLLNHSNQVAANNFLHTVAQPLLRTDCSEYLRHFLCSAVYPLCFPGRFRQIHPCRELCVSVRESCIPVLTSNGLTWPEEFDCNLFSSYGDTLCVWIEGSPCGRRNTVIPSVDQTLADTTRTETCTGRLISVANTSSAVFGNVEHCTEPCKGVYFDDQQHQLLLIWITVLSLITLLICIVVFLTYLLNYRKVPSLEAPIYYIALCYAIVSLVYIVSMAIGKNSVICEPQYQNHLNESALLTEPTNHPLCLILFCVLHYFTLCTWSWWVACTAQWFVASVKAQDIDNKWKVCFHIIAWSIPLVFTLSALSLGHVSGDPTVRTCWIEKRYEIPFLVSPLLTAVLVCSIVLIICFARIVKLQKSQKQVSDSDSATRLKLDPVVLVRVGLYCTLYLVPMGLLLCVYFYEYWYREAWEKHYLECVSSTAGLCGTSNSPVFPIFIVKIAATLGMGMVAVLWIIGLDFVRAWKRVCCLCFSQPPTQRVNVYTVKENVTPNFQLHHLVDYPTSTDSSV